MGGRGDRGEKVTPLPVRAERAEHQHLRRFEASGRVSSEFISESGQSMVHLYAASGRDAIYATE